MADLETMFHQVKVPTEDADPLWFLCWLGTDINKTLLESRMVVQLFGATSSLSCPSYALRKFAEEKTDLFDATVISIIYIV